MDVWENQNIKPKGKIGITHTGDGRLMLLLRSDNGSLYLKEETANGIMSKWEDVLEVESENVDPESGILLALHRRDNRMSAFALGKNGIIYSGWLVREKENYAICWKKMDGTSGGTIAVCERCSGGLELFSLDPQNRLWHAWTNKEGFWSDQKLLGGSSDNEIDVENNQEGFPQAFIISGEGSLYTSRHHSDGMWGEWQLLKSRNVRRISTMREKSGKIRIFIADADGRIQTCCQKENPDEWHQWEDIGVQDAKELEAGYDEQQKMTVWSVGNDGCISIIKKQKSWVRTKCDDKDIVKCHISSLKSGTIYGIAVKTDCSLYLKEDTGDCQ